MLRAHLAHKPQILPCGGVTKMRSYQTTNSRITFSSKSFISGNLEKEILAWPRIYLDIFAQVFVPKVAPGRRFSIARSLASFALSMVQHRILSQLSTRPGEGFFCHSFWKRWTNSHSWRGCSKSTLNSSSSRSTVGCPRWPKEFTEECYDSGQRRQGVPRKAGHARYPLKSILAGTPWIRVVIKRASWNLTRWRRNA